ncbi:hypothetical protein DRO61_10260, partial [Candidatus Bathyarchaeota archaeon]
SYRKIQDGGQVLNSSIPKEEALPMEEPMTYFSCPNCNNPKLLSCDCWPVNYYCKCGWKHLNHSHESSRFKGRDINHSALLAKNIRS